MSITFPGGSGSLTSIMNDFPTLNREQLAEKQAVLSSGTADYDDMTERNGILVAENIASVGDTLQLEGRSPMAARLISTQLLQAPMTRPI